jgi:uncharacterized cupin superfamily protein
MDPTDIVCATRSHVKPPPGFPLVATYFKEASVIANSLRTASSRVVLFVAIGACSALALAADDGTYLISVDAHASVGKLAPIGKDALTPDSPVPLAGGRVFYSTSDKSVRVGVWESDPGTLKLDMPIAEFIHVVEGKTIIRDTAGKEWTYKAGDSFLLLPGFKGTAEIVGHFKKEFVDVKVPSQQ